MRSIFSLWLVACLVIYSGGCGLRRPFERPPGSIAQQRSDAAEHDPYVDNDAGPEVVGGRPREFAEPRSEPVRNRPYEPSGARAWFSSWFN